MLRAHIARVFGEALGLSNGTQFKLQSLHDLCTSWSHCGHIVIMCNIAETQCVPEHSRRSLILLQLPVATRPLFDVNFGMQAAEKAARAKREADCNSCKDKVSVMFKLAKLGGRNNYTNQRLAHMRCSSTSTIKVSCALMVSACKLQCLETFALADKQGCSCRVLPVS